MAPVQDHLSSDSNAGSSQTKRYFISEMGDSKYLLPADDQERERLDLQGRLINRLFDGKLIWAPVSLKDGDIIVDSGTGSGHWLLSVAKELSAGVQLRGIDIASRMFPPNTPPNATFVVGSVTALPVDWTSSISLIHQRLLFTALQEHEWKAALKEMYRVLVPGGWVQLFEPIPEYESPSEAVCNHLTQRIRNKLCIDTRKVALDVTHHLPRWLEEAGFVVHKTEPRKMPLGTWAGEPWAGEDGRLCQQVTLGFFQATKEVVLKQGGFGLITAEDYDTVEKDIMRLLEETPESYFVYVAHVAQKPLAPN